MAIVWFVTIFAICLMASFTVRILFANVRQTKKTEELSPLGLNHSPLLWRELADAIEIGHQITWRA